MSESKLSFGMTSRSRVKMSNNPSTVPMMVSINSLKRIAFMFITLFLVQFRYTTATINLNKATNTIMTANSNNDCSKFDFLDDLRSKYPHQPVFLQAVEEMALAIEPLFHDPVNGDFYKRAFLYMTEPERMISFHVPWMDDEGNLNVNRGWRVEFSRCVKNNVQKIVVCYADWCIV
jgi:hypothetical protein